MESWSFIHQLCKRRMIASGLLVDLLAKLSFGVFLELLGSCDVMTHFFSWSETAALFRLMCLICLFSWMWTVCIL